MKPRRERFGIKFPNHAQFTRFCYQCKYWTPRVYTWPSYPQGGASGRCRGDKVEDAYCPPCMLFEAGDKEPMPKIDEWGAVIE